MADIKLFISWAHADSELASSFLQLLEPRLNIVRNHNFTLWEFSLIPIGEEWEQEILKQWNKANYIIQLVSPHFLNSEFIRKHEIPEIGDATRKKSLPVMLDDVPLDKSMNLHQIDERQIYRGSFNHPHSYISCTTEYERRQFVNGFVEKLLERVDRKTGYR